MTSDPIEVIVGTCTVISTSEYTGNFETGDVDVALVISTSGTCPGFDDCQVNWSGTITPSN